MHNNPHNIIQSSLNDGNQPAPSLPMTHVPVEKETSGRMQV